VRRIIDTEITQGSIRQFKAREGAERAESPERTNVLRGAEFFIKIEILEQFARAESPVSADALLDTQFYSQIRDLGRIGEGGKTSG
jgi:hypothetical protein